MFREITITDNLFVVEEDLSRYYTEIRIIMFVSAFLRRELILMIAKIMSLNYHEDFVEVRLKIGLHKKAEIDIQFLCS